jgi:hypothetical protein
VDVAIPKSCHDGATAAPDHFGIGWNSHLLPDGNNPAVVHDNGCVRKRQGSRGRVYDSIYDGQGLGLRRARE